MLNKTLMISTLSLALSTMLAISAPVLAQAEATLVGTATSLTEQEQDLLKWVDLHQKQMLDELKEHVEINTGTANIAGLNEYRDLLERELRKLGFKTETHASAPIDVISCHGEQVQIADHLSGRLESQSGGSDKLRILLNGHMDTVFPPTDEFQTLTIADDGTLTGPGVADMKGGIVILLNTLRALQSQGLLDEANLTVLFNSDEEIGSLGSRGLIERVAKQHDIGLVFEGTYDNKVTRARKGLGQARLKVTGRESHAGGAHEEGVSANLELAHKVIEIEALTDYSRKVTVNTGVMSGGEKRNTVPGCADAYVDMRFPTIAEGERLKVGIESIARKKHTGDERFPAFPSTDVWAVLHRPAKEVHPKVDELIVEAMSISQLTGEAIVGTHYSGGGTDGSIAQGVGLPTMDSMGMDGIGAHSSREASTVASLIARTKLAAVMLSRQLRKPSTRTQGR